MTQRFLTFLSVLTLFIAYSLPLSHALANEASQPTSSSKTTPEQAFMQGIDCLKQDNIECATMAHLSIPSTLIYAKVLEASIAAKQNNIERVFQLLLPVSASQALQKEDILPQAVYATHQLLAEAYASEGNAAQSLVHFNQADIYLATQQTTMQDAYAQNQLALTHMLAALSPENLLQIRGESEDSNAQGWVDLVISSQQLATNPVSIEQWRKAYPDHPASAQTISSLSQQQLAQTAQAHARIGKIALLLPLQNQDFYAVADAIERGFSAAKNIDEDSSEVALYPTNADKNEILTLYQRAIAEGAKFVIGPLTRDEVNALLSQTLAVPTIALNHADTPKPQANEPRMLYSLTLSMDDEAKQLVQYALNAGMQTAHVIAEQNNALSKRMAEAFSTHWQAQGKIVNKTEVIANTLDASALKQTLAAQPSDMLVIAGNYVFARKINAAIGASTPLFGFSHMYSGVNADPEDAPLVATQFVDLPWVITPNEPAFQGYQAAAQALPIGQLQRWFALGADAFHLLKHLASNPQQTTVFEGLSGKISLDSQGVINRQLPLARFSPQGLVLESKP
jgi:uncharacterized protein